MITKYDDILSKMDQINPIRYANDRNFIDGSVTKLSPYISSAAATVFSISLR